MLGLFLKLVNPVVFIGMEKTEAGSILPRNLTHGNGQIGTLLDVSAKHGIVVHLIDVIAGENQDIIRIPLLDESDVLIDGVGGTLVPFAGFSCLIGGQNENTAIGQIQIPGRARSNVGIQFKRSVLSQNTNHVNTGVGAVGKRKVNDPELSTERNCRLGDLLGQNAETATLSTCQQHGNTFFLPHGSHTPYIWICN